MAKKGFIQKKSKDIPSFDVCNANLDDGAQVKGLHRSYLVTPNASLLTEPQVILHEDHILSKRQLLLIELMQLQLCADHIFTPRSDLYSMPGTTLHSSSA